MGVHCHFCPADAFLHTFGWFSRLNVSVSVLLYGLKGNFTVLTPKKGIRIKKKQLPAMFSHRSFSGWTGDLVFKNGPIVSHMEDDG